jgi:hypothetical protein
LQVYKGLLARKELQGYRGSLVHKALKVQLR